MRQASSRRLVKFHSCVVEIRNSWLLEIPQRHFLEGAKDRERRVRLAANECVQSREKVISSLGIQCLFSSYFYKYSKVWKTKRNLL